MAVQDILSRAFAGEEASARRQPQLSVGLPEAPPPPLPVSAISAPEPPASSGIDSLLPLLLQSATRQNGMQNGMQGGQGLSNFSAGGGAPAGLARRIGGWIDSRPGFTVSGLEGYNGTGQISSGHIDNSQHYTGHAGDVSYVGGGRFNGEMAALDWLYNKLNRRWGDELTELIWRAPDHYDHLHYGTRPGG